jgi:hypothetical protein
MVQGSNGLNLLTGKSFGTFAAGGRVDLIWGPATLWGVFTQTGSAAQYQTPYGQWIGYTKQITKDFDRAGERAWQVGVIYDFAGIGLPGLLFTGSATLGDDAINPANGAVFARMNEYDLDLIYQVAARTAGTRRLCRPVPERHDDVDRGVSPDPELRTDLQGQRPLKDRCPKRGQSAALSAT